ncbi:MAG: hypothetical protein ACYS9V_10255 [Planctomycetota bacterium]|jgi:hypothetical protein
MFRKFVLLIFLPDWAGAEGSWWGIWGFYSGDVLFEEEGVTYWNPTESLGLSDYWDFDPYWEFTTSPDSWIDDGGIWWEGQGDPTFNSGTHWGPAGENKIIRTQYTVWIEPDNPWDTWLGIWAEPTGYCMWEEINDGAPFTFEDALADNVETIAGVIIDVQELGGGMLYICLETEIWLDEGAYEVGELGDPYFGYGAWFSSEYFWLEEIVIDFISYDGDEPPKGPGRGKVIQVSDISPRDGESTVRCDVNEVSFYPPEDAVVMDPEADPNLKGPFDFYVYGDVNEANVTDRIDLIATILNHDTNEQTIVETGFIAPGETYYWLVDINDQNDGGDPCLYEGPVFSYVKWGFATLVSPPDGDDTIDPGLTLTLVWENDGYADNYKVDVYGPDFYDGTSGATQEANEFTITSALALGQEYWWNVQECNDWQGSELCVEGPWWSFTTTLCETVDDFESYSNLEGTGNAWKDWYDDATSTNAVINHLEDTTGAETEAAQALAYQRDPPDSVKSMNVNVDRDFLNTKASGLYEDYTWYEPSDANLARDGGKTIWVAYRSADPGASSPDPANNEQIFMGFESSDSNTANIDYPGDVCDPEWSIFFVSLSEATDQGVDVTDIAEIRLGATGDDDNTGLFDVYFDLMVRCGAICPADFGYPDEVQGAFAPPYSILASDLVFDCVVDETDLEVITNVWLDEDYTVTPVEPNSDFLLVEYTFDAGNSNDTSGNDIHGVDTNAPSYADGKVTLDGNDFIEIPFVDNPFGGTESYTITFDVNTVDHGLIFSSAREPNCDDPCGVDQPWDPEDPCSAPYVDTWPLAIFSYIYGEDPEEIAAAHIYNGSTGMEAEPGVEHRAVYVYNAEEGTGIMYVDNVTQWSDIGYHDIPEPNEDTVLIGTTLNCFGPDEWQEEPMGRFIGTLDNVRVYSYAFSDMERLYYSGITEPYPVPVDPIANMYATGDPEADDGDIINFFDHGEFAKQWMEENFFE